MSPFGNCYNSIYLGLKICSVNCFSIFELPKIQEEDKQQRPTTPRSYSMKSSGWNQLMDTNMPACWPNWSVVVFIVFKICSVFDRWLSVCIIIGPSNLKLSQLSGCWTKTFFLRVYSFFWGNCHSCLPAGALFHAKSCFRVYFCRKSFSICDLLWSFAIQL